MAKIGKIRFVNFTYNDNRHIYDQTFDFYKGEDTLLNLQNGGGKTVLVQMMMQPIIPKQKLKDRLFKSYFSNSKAPVYIMIEWLLDNSAKRVLTGIGIKRIMGKNTEDESESLKIVTFISEYEEESRFDIRNIELLEEERGIVKLIEFDKVIRNLSNAEKEGSNVWLFRWDLPDDKKEYARRLLEYTINQLEWKNLMVRINESEAGLNSFFNDCKTNSSLIKKWFIPTIEEQLNKTGNLVENIKELIKNHAGQIVKNEGMIREKEIFESFKAKSLPLIKGLEDYAHLLNKAEKNKSNLGNAYLFVNNEIRLLGNKKEELEADIKKAENSVKELGYEKISGEYHEIADDLQQLKESVSHTDEKIAGYKMDSDELLHKRKLLWCARLSDELKNINSKVVKFETELEKESLQQDDIKKIVNDLEYSLKEKYRQKIAIFEKTVDEEKKNIKDQESKLSKTYNDYEEAAKQISSLNEELIIVRSRIAVFDEAENSLMKAYEDFVPVKNINTGEYNADCIDDLCSRFDLEGAFIEKSILDINNRQIENQREIELLEKENLELRNKNQVLAIEKSKKEAEYHLFEAEKGSIEKIIKSYQLADESIYDKESLLTPLHADVEKYNKLIYDRSLENSILKKQLGLYESGKAFELNEEIKKVFDDANIFVEYGYEWLRGINDNKISKIRLVKNNPFLPNAIIVSQKDLNRIKDLDFKVFLQSVIPIIEREKLEKALIVKSTNNIHSMGEIDFLISFDDRTLNKNYLKEISDDLISSINKNSEIIKNAQESLKNTELNILKAEGFMYTKEAVDKLSFEIENISVELDENAKRILQIEEGIISVKKNNASDSKQLSTLQDEKNRYMRKRDDIKAFMGKLHGYYEDLKSKRQTEEDLKNLRTALEALDKDIKKMKDNMGDISLKLANINAILERDIRKYQKYADAESGSFIDEDIEKLEARLVTYSTQISGKIQGLKDILEDYRRQRNEKQKELSDSGIEEGLYIGVEFNEFEFEGINRRLSEIDDTIAKLNESKNSLQLRIAEKNSDIKHVLKSIIERYGYEEPKQKEYIRKVDFQKEKDTIKARLKDFEKELTALRLWENNLNRVRFRLEEYAAFSTGIVDIRSIEEDLNSHVKKLSEEYNEIASLASDAVNKLSSLYTGLESEFSIKAEVFRSLFNSILDQGKRYQPVYAQNAFGRVFLQIDRKLEQHSIDLGKIDDMENCIIDNTLSYLKNVYDEMSAIDRNSTIDVDGKRCKMLIISLPGKDELETLALKEYLKNTIRNCVSLLKQGKSMDGLLSNEISTYDLFDRLVCINKIGITLVKIEPNKLKKKSWKQVIEENSGGEKFVSAFVVFISLLAYMRGESQLGSCDSKVLIMDNPFGPITSEHLLKPLFEIAKKYDTQLICLTDLKEHSIFDRFNLIYSLNIEREVGREDEYIELKTIKKDINEEEDEILSASMFKIEDKSRFELIN